jgi:CRISPR type III-B/RAMP module-associated protein Cmr5
LRIDGNKDYALINGEEAMYLLSEDSVHAAIEDFELLVKLLKGHPKDKDLEKKIRARAQEVLTYIWSGGLATTLTFYLAKGGEEGVKMFKTIFEGEERLPEDLDLEEAAYAIILYLVLKRLKWFGFIKSGLEDPRGCLHELIEINLFERTYVLDLLTSYLLEFKKLCEATFREL